MICWFWNEDLSTNLPVLGTLMHSYYNEEKQLRYVTSENPGISFSLCEYAGTEAIPEKFQKMMDTKTLVNEKPFFVPQD